MKPRACFVRQGPYPGDPRLSTEIAALRQAGYDVDVICSQIQSEAYACREQGVTIRRVPSLTRTRANKLRYVLEYVSFFVPCFLLMAFLQLRFRYRLVHVANLPDTLVFAALIPRLLGAKILLDVRECTPEMFIDRFEASPGGKAVKLLVRIEQSAIRFAHAVVTCTEQQRQALIMRGAAPNKIIVILNLGRIEIVNKPTLACRVQPTDDSFRIITHGTIIKRYGHPVLVKAMPFVIEKIPQAHLDIMGSGKEQSELERLVQSMGLSDAVTFGGFVPYEELLKRLQAAHCGVIPLLRNPESDLVHTFKMFEYIALGIPVVITYTAAVAAYFDERCLSFFTSGNERELARAIIDLYENPEKRYCQAQNALKMLEQYSPARQRAAYSGLVQKLMKGPIEAEQLTPQRGGN